MAVDLNVWRNQIKQAVDAIADEKFQRRAWFGIGPEETGPDEDICQFLGNAAIEDFLNRNDTGLNDRQTDAGRHLVKLMHQLLTRTPTHIDPSELIDDPEWKKIREAASQFSALLATGTARNGDRQT
jgi:hypothetical protein